MSRFTRNILHSPGAAAAGSSHPEPQQAWLGQEPARPVAVAVKRLLTDNDEAAVAGAQPAAAAADAHAVAPGGCGGGGSGP